MLVLEDQCGGQTRYYSQGQHKEKSLKVKRCPGNAVVCLAQLLKAPFQITLQLYLGEQ